MEPDQNLGINKIPIARPIFVSGPGLRNTIFLSHKNMRACKKSAPYDPIWPRLAYWPFWPRKALFGPFWPRFTPFGPVLPCLAPFGPVLPRLAPLSPAWPLFNFHLKVL